MIIRPEGNRITLQSPCPTSIDRSAAERPFDACHGSEQHEPLDGQYAIIHTEFHVRAKFISGIEAAEHARDWQLDFLTLSIVPLHPAHGVGAAQRALDIVRCR